MVWFLHMTIILYSQQHGLVVKTMIVMDVVEVNNRLVPFCFVFGKDTL